MVENEICFMQIELLIACQQIQLQHENSYAKRSICKQEHIIIIIKLSKIDQHPMYERLTHHIDVHLFHIFVQPLVINVC